MNSCHLGNGRHVSAGMASHESCRTQPGYVDDPKLQPLLADIDNDLDEGTGLTAIFYFLLPLKRTGMDLIHGLGLPFRVGQLCSN